jgi:hypothetical protein
MAKLALRFISGKYKGGEFALKPDAQVVIGRSSDLDVVLMEDMVSRRHAFLNVKGDKIHLRDNGSTNGTFVNGEKVSQAVVNKGDRILIGTSIMKVVDASADGAGVQTADQQPVRQQDMSRTTMHSASRSLSGTIAEVPLPDLIQLFSTSKKTGTLVLNRGTLVAKIHLDRGRLVYATISDSPGLAPTKAIFRLLAWEDGTFELLGPEAKSFPDQINMPTEHILMEGLRQLDELRHMQNKLPPMESKLAVPRPLKPRLAELAEPELDVFQLALASSTVQQVLDEATASDLDAAGILAKLIKRKYVVVKK